MNGKETRSFLFFKETEFFEFSPIHLLDEFVEEMFDLLSKALATMSQTIQELHPESDSDTINAMKIYSRYIEKVSVKNMDVFNLYCLRNIFRMPEGYRSEYEKSICAHSIPRGGEEAVVKRITDETLVLLEKIKKMSFINQMYEEEHIELIEEAKFLDSVDSLISPFSQLLVDKVLLSGLEEPYAKLEEEINKSRTGIKKINEYKRRNKQNIGKGNESTGENDKNYIKREKTLQMLTKIADTQTLTRHVKFLEQQKAKT